MKYNPLTPIIPLPDCGSTSPASGTLSRPAPLESPPAGPGEGLGERSNCLVSVIGVALEDFGNAMTSPSSPPHEEGQGEVSGTILVFVNLEHQRLTANTDLEGLITIESDSNDTNYHSNVSNRLKFNATAIFTAKLIAENGQWELNEQGYLKIKELEVERIKVAGANAGLGRIVAGDTGITINSKSITDNSEIFVTFLTDLAGRTWHISEKTPGEHFTLKLSGNLAYDADFRWWIVDFENQEVQYSSIPYPTPAAQTPSQSPPITDQEVGAGGETVGETSTSTATTTADLTPQ